MTSSTASRYEHHESSSLEQGTVMLCLLAAAALVMFATPHYFTLSVFDIGPLQLGNWSDPHPSTVEPWQIGDYGQLRHLRYRDGSTCTQAVVGPFVVQACR